MSGIDPTRLARAAFGGARHVQAHDVCDCMEAWDALSDAEKAAWEEAANKVVLEFIGQVGASGLPLHAVCEMGTAVVQVNLQPSTPEERTGYDKAVARISGAERPRGVRRKLRGPIN
ncbi:MAG: hypothetical protein KC620_10250 [Myxococcales bacterium]|nr:hypothetical protein [Myxococcales bacterium]